MIESKNKVVEYNVKKKKNKHILMDGSKRKIRHKQLERTEYFSIVL